MRFISDLLLDRSFFQTNKSILRKNSIKSTDSLTFVFRSQTCFFLFLDLHLLPSFNPDGYEKSTIGDCDGKGMHKSSLLLILRNSVKNIYLERKKERIYLEC